MRGWLAAVLLVLSGCDCGRAGVAGRFADVTFVQPTADGEVTLLKSATVAVPPVFMGETGEATVPLRNLGLAEGTVASVTLVEGDPSLSVEGVGVKVSPERDGALTVRFAAPQASDASAAETAHRARFAVTIEGAAEGEGPLELTVTALAVARDCFVPAKVSFGRVPLSHAVKTGVVLRNGGPIATTTVVGPVTGSSTFTVSPAALEVPAQGEAALVVRFEPLEAVTSVGRVQVRRSPACPEATMELEGTGSDEALSWAPAQLQFGRVPLESTAVRAVTFLSSMAVPVGMTVSALSGPFSLEGAAPTQLVAAGQTVVTVACTPQMLGANTGQLEVRFDTEPVLVARVPLTCAGGGPRIAVSPNPLLMGSLPVAETTRRRLIVQNVGTAPVNGDTSMNLKLGRDGQSLPWFSIVPKNASTTPDEFTVSLLSAYDPSVGVPAIAGRNLIEFEVTMTPRPGTDIQERVADLLIYSNDAVEPVARVPLRALPRLPERCSVTIEPAAFDFGRVPPGATLERTVVVRSNTFNGGVCLLSGLELAPGSDLPFRVTMPMEGGLLVPDGQPRAIIVTMVVPTDAVEGTFFRGNVRFHVSGNTDQTIPVSALVSKCIVASPTVLNLGVVQKDCTSASRAVTFHNVCGVPVTLTLPALPAPFAYTSAPTSPLVLAPANSTVAQVAARGTTLGPVSALVNAEVNGADQVPVVINANVTPDGLQTEQFDQTVDLADILLVIDNSCSMSDKQAALAANFSALMSATQNTQVDWHFGVVTTDVAERGVLRRGQGNPPVLTRAMANVELLYADKVKVGILGAGIEQPFESLVSAVSPSNLAGNNAGFIRDEAPLAVLIVTDAQEQSQLSPAATLAALVQAKRGVRDLVNVSVVGPFSPPSSTCRTEGLDTTGRYDALVQATGGKQLDICTTDWSASLRDLSTQLFSRRKTFELTGQARTAADITVRVNGQLASGWTWDPTTRSVVFSAATIPPANAVIEVTYRTACL